MNKITAAEFLKIINKKDEIQILRNYDLSGQNLEFIDLQNWQLENINYV